jgi:probable HAF family extracellular repeat protein
MPGAFSRMAHVRFRSVSLGLLLCLSAVPAHALRYVVRAVDGIDQAQAINAQGDVAGAGPLDDYLRSHAIVSRGGVVVDLGTLEGDAGSAAAADINDGGTVVGWSTLGDAVHAFMWRDGVMQDLGDLGTTWYPRVSESGLIAGTRYTYDPFVERATLWVDGIPSALPPLPGGAISYGTDIDAAGRVVGYSPKADAFYHATRWTNGVPFDLGVLPGEETNQWATSYARATNDAGDVVGQASFGLSQNHAFLYRDGTMRDLGSLGGPSSDAAAINRLGQVVGTSMIDPGHVHAFVWDEASGLRDLNTLIDPASGWVLRTATGINDAGVIIGQGTLGAFVASPDTDEDGVPDETDPCTNVAATSPDRFDLVLRAKKLRLRADVVVPADPAIDPVTHGFRLVLSDSVSGAFVDATIPGGAGWYDDGRHAHWRAPRGMSVGGLTRVRLRRLWTPGALHVDVVGDGVVPAPTLPIDVTIVVDAPITHSGQCAETTIVGDRCSPVREGAPLRCRSSVRRRR